MARPLVQRGASVLALAAFALLPLGAALATRAAPRGPGPVAAIFPPWWSAERSVVAAGTAGPVLRLGALPFVVVAAADHARLRQAGAWLLLDPFALAACGPQ